MFRVSRYCLLESLAHANIATVADGELTVMERRQWNSGFCQDFLNSSTWEEPRPQWNSGFSQDLLASVEAWGEYWENEAWDNFSIVRDMFENFNIMIEVELNGMELLLKVGF